MRIRNQDTIQRLAIALALPVLALVASPAITSSAEPPNETSQETSPVADAASDAVPAPASAETTQPAPDAEEFFTQGRDALFGGQYDWAIELLGQAVAADKTKTSYRLYLARAYRYAGQHEQAATQLDEILKTSPDHVEAGQALAEIHSEAKRFKDVVRVLEPLLKYRHDYLTYHMLAEAQYNLGEHEKARKHYEEAVKLNPDSPSDHYQLGNIYLSGNFFALAAESYQSALRLGLDSAVLHYKLGSAYFNLRNYFGQVTIQTVKSGQPGTISGKWYLIEPVPEGKDVFRCAPEASAAYQIAKALADGIEDRPDIHVLRATIYLNARRYAQAYEMFTKIGDTVPKEDKALFAYYYSQAAFGTGQYDRYLELLQEAIQLDPEAYKSTLVDAYTKVAQQYNQAGQLDRYIEYLAKAVAESPQSALLHHSLGNAYEEALKHDQAVAQWRMVLDLEPEHPQRMQLLNLIGKYQSGLSFSATPAEPPQSEKPKPRNPNPAKPKATKPAAKKQ
ncbi:MAG: tetratricopeptide repeat protein [Pirellulales bacterium]|nr:tetratricopeptide repeat protein [Pirellulales bacterium]